MGTPLSKRAQAVADRPAFPKQINDAGDVAYPGMTYHQYLVGQALAGPVLDRIAAEHWHDDITADLACTLADAVCEILARREAGNAD